MECIAPQHGSIIKKPQITPLIEQMKTLECGLYLEEGYRNELLLSLSKSQRHTLYLKDGVYWDFDKKQLLWHDTEILLNPKEKIILALLISKVNHTVSAIDIFNQFGINVYTGAPSILPQTLVEQLLDNTLVVKDNACDGGHHDHGHAHEHHHH